MENALSASDVALLNGRNDGMYGENGIIWFFLGAMMGGNGGWFGNNNRNDTVTEAGLCNAMNFNNLENSVGRMGDQQVQLAMQSQRDLCTSTATLSGQIAELVAQVERCCCETNRNIDAVRYENSQNTSQIIRSQENGTQKILDYLCNQETQRLRDENMRNYIASQFCGVVRYPNQMAYNAGTSPFCGCGCNGNNGGFGNI